MYLILPPLFFLSVLLSNQQRKQQQQKQQETSPQLEGMRSSPPVVCTKEMLRNNMFWIWMDLHACQIPVLAGITLLLSTCRHSDYSFLRAEGKSSQSDLKVDNNSRVIPALELKQVFARKLATFRRAGTLSYSFFSSGSMEEFGCGMQVDDFSMVGMAMILTGISNC